jgi:hypothetical protein
MSPLEEAAHRLVDSIEAVFHSDWEYTRSHGLGLPPPDRDARAKLGALFGEEVEEEPEGATFLGPKMSASDLEAQDWGNYELFLER